MKKINRFIKLILIMSLLFLPSIARCSDVSINPTGPVYSLNGLVWGTAGANGFNNNFFFSPLYLSESVCVFVYNNNPTNAHTYNAQISYTGNITSTSPADGTWNAYSSPLSFSVSASPSTGAIIGAATSGAGLISVNFTNSSTQAGNPDTANVRIVQTTNGNCMVALNASIGQGLQNTSSGQAQTTPLQLVSDVYKQAFSENITFTPAGAAEAVALTAGSKNVYLDKLIISSSVANTINIGLAASPGTTCSTPVTLNLYSGASSPAQTSTSNFNCSGVGGTSIGTIAIPANQEITIDLRGIILNSSQPDPVFVGTTSVAATVTGTLFFYEK